MPPPADAIIPAREGDGEARRQALAAFARLARSPRPRLLFVTHGRGGGVARHVRELAAILASRADILVLRPHRRSFVALEGSGEFADARLWFHHRDWASLVALLRAVGVARLHLHHVQGLPPAVLDLGREIGCSWDATIHDYYPACPQYQLTDASGRYCGEPDEAGCARCLSANPAQWPMAIGEWRAAFARFLGEAARVIAPSQDAAARIARHFPGVSPVAWPHAEPHAAPAATRKVLVLGGLSPAKGMDLLVACARDAVARALALRFRVVGHLAWPVDGERLPVSFTGEYAEGELAALLEQERADAVFFPAQWPETWSYTLGEAIASGLPILATDLGAFRERLAGLSRARLLPWDAPAALFNDALVEMAAPPASRWIASSADARAIADRHLDGVEARPGDPEGCLALAGGLAPAPDEALPQATLVELFDDGVRSGNGRSMAELRARLPEADHAIESARASSQRASDLGAALAEARARAGALDRDLGTARAAAAGLEARVAALEASTSWRLTAPLRALARMLRR
jgi:glycosyltransferase involved in cell wall biosynthesis